MIRAVLLAKILRLSGLLSLGVGTSTYLFVSILLIYNGLPKEISLELAAAAAVGSASLMEFIDSLVGISYFLQRRQETVFLLNLEKDIRSGKMTFKEALEKVVERRFLSELGSTPWYQFKKRKATKNKLENRIWIINNILPYTLDTAPKDTSIELLCQHLYEMDEFVTKHRFAQDDKSNIISHERFYSDSLLEKADLFEIVGRQRKELLLSKENRAIIEEKIITDD